MECCSCGLVSIARCVHTLPTSINGIQSSIVSCIFNRLFCFFLRGFFVAERSFECIILSGVHISLIRSVREHRRIACISIRFLFFKWYSASTRILNWSKYFRWCFFFFHLFFLIPFFYFSSNSVCYLDFDRWKGMLDSYTIVKILLWFEILDGLPSRSCLHFNSNLNSAIQIIRFKVLNFRQDSVPWIHYVWATTPFCR